MPVISTQLERAEGKCATYVETEVINCFQAPFACLHIMHFEKLSIGTETLGEMVEGVVGCYSICQQCGTPGDGEQVTARRPPSHAKNIHHLDIFLLLNTIILLHIFFKAPTASYVS